jgi:hypothetical protein
MAGAIFEISIEFQSKPLIFQTHFRPLPNSPKGNLEWVVNLVVIVNYRSVCRSPKGDLHTSLEGPLGPESDLGTHGCVRCCGRKTFVFSGKAFVSGKIAPGQKLYGRFVNYLCNS